MSKPRLFPPSPAHCVNTGVGWVDPVVAATPFALESFGIARAEQIPLTPRSSSRRLIDIAAFRLNIPRVPEFELLGLCAHGHHLCVGSSVYPQWTAIVHQLRRAGKGPGKAGKFCPL